MTTNCKTALITLLILLIPVGLGVGGYIYIKKKKDSSEDGGSKANESADNTTASGTTSSDNIKGKTTTAHPNSTFPLRKNAAVKSDKVKELQELLNERIVGLQAPNVPYYDNKAILELKEDGYYGDKTAAVVRFVFNDPTGSIVTEDMFNELKNGTSKYLYI